MSNLHRLQWIDAMIRAGRYPNCRRIADKFEISARQAARDIEYLRDSLSAPIEYSAEHNGYCYSSEAFVLPTVVVSEEERRTLAALAAQYAGLRSQTGARLAEIFGRLAGPIHAGKERGAGTSRRTPCVLEEVEAYQLLRQAIDERRVVRLVYKDQAGERTERTLLPLQAVYQGARPLCRGLLPTARGVAHPAARSHRPGGADGRVLRDRALLSRTGLWRGRALDVLQTLMSPPCAWLGRFDSVTLRWRVLEQDGDIYRIEFRGSDELISYLLTLSVEFSILSPRWLKERLLERLDRIRARHL